MKKPPKKAPTYTRKGLAFGRDDQDRLDRIRYLLKPEMGDLKDMTIIRLALISYEMKQQAIQEFNSK